jgi:hypothetical protein
LLGSGGIAARNSWLSIPYPYHYTEMLIFRTTVLYNREEEISIDA